MIGDRNEPLTIGQLVQLACILEATARKPGNVHPQKSFNDLHYVDFVVSALAIGDVLPNAAVAGVGLAIRDSICSTRKFVTTNTNLGMVLLLAPLAAVPGGERLADGIGRVLEGLTIEDARQAYEAIRIANPGGLGRAAEQDVTDVPTETLTQVMSRAADRDLVARQFSNGFRDVFASARSLESAVAEGLDWEQAVIRAHLQLMARYPDTLIARKRGDLEARESAARAQAVLDANWPRTPESLQLFDELDNWLRDALHQRNPGSTADLIAASLFVALRDGTMLHNMLRVTPPVK